MSELKIALLGMDAMTTSIGLALKQYQAKGGMHQFKIHGYDLEDQKSHDAKKAEALDANHKYMDAAVKDADIVVMNLSFDQLRLAYKEISQHIREGALILDMSPLIKSSIQWHTDYLTEEQHLIGMNPVLKSSALNRDLFLVENASADLFQSATVLLCPSASNISSAVELAVNFIKILGANVQFIDPQEYDVLNSYSSHLPELLNATLLYYLRQSQGWDDIQKLTDSVLAQSTQFLWHKHPDALRDLWLAASSNLVHGLDEYIVLLQQIRKAIANQDTDTLEGLSQSSVQTYIEWYRNREVQAWDKPTQPIESKGSFLGSLIGEKWAKKLSGSDE
ncbi:prephenate/arogenate dehydrogenase family protein [Anaerolineales bacterium]